MEDDFKDSITARDTWIRLLYMVLFAFIYSVAELVLIVSVVIQFLIVLVSRNTNERLLEFGEDLGVFIFQIIQFETFNSEEKPFPLGPWPYGGDENLERELSRIAAEDEQDPADSADPDKPPPA